MNLREVTIGQLESDGCIEEIQDGNHGEIHPKATDYVDEGVPFIMASDIRNGRVETETANKLPQSITDRLRIGFCHGGDVLLSHKGSVGYVAIAPDYDPYLMLTPQVTYYRVNKNKLSREFLSYAFREPIFQKRLASAAGEQGTRGYVGIKAQRRLTVRFAKSSLQDRIVNVIKPYDDLLENNRRRIELLEEAARLLHREWFVYFRYPGHEHSQLVRGLPSGWKNGTLADVAETNRSSYRAGKLPDEINYVDIASVTKGRIVSKTLMPSIEAPGRARRRANDGDVIWSNVRPNLRAFALVHEPNDVDVFSTGFTILSPKDVPFTWLYLSVTTESFVGYLVNQATGVGYPAVRPDDFERAPVVVPPKALLDLFHESTESNFRLISKLEQQNRKLIEARDLLLPRLMNGEIEV